MKDYRSLGGYINLSIRKADEDDALPDDLRLEGTILSIAIVFLNELAQRLFKQSIEKTTSPKQGEQEGTLLDEVTDYFAGVLPNLITRCRMEPTDAARLSMIVCFLKLDLFVEGQRLHAFKQILQEVSNLVVIHDDTDAQLSMLNTIKHCLMHDAVSQATLQIVMDDAKGCVRDTFVQVIKKTKLALQGEPGELGVRVERNNIAAVYLRLSNITKVFDPAWSPYLEWRAPSITSAWATDTTSTTDLYVDSLRSVRALTEAAKELLGGEQEDEALLQAFAHGMSAILGCTLWKVYRIHRVMHASGSAFVAPFDGMRTPMPANAGVAPTAEARNAAKALVSERNWIIRAVEAAIEIKEVPVRVRHDVHNLIAPLILMGGSFLWACII